MQAPCPCLSTAPPCPRHNSSGARQRSQLAEALEAGLNAAASRLGSPNMAVGAVRLENSTLVAHIAGEAIPRRLENINAVGEWVGGWVAGWVGGEGQLYGAEPCWVWFFTWGR